MSTQNEKDCVACGCFTACAATCTIIPLGVVWLVYCVMALSEDFSDLPSGCNQNDLWIYLLASLITNILPFLFPWGFIVLSDAQNQQCVELTSSLLYTMCNITVWLQVVGFIIIVLMCCVGCCGGMAALLKS